MFDTSTSTTSARLFLLEPVTRACSGGLSGSRSTHCCTQWNTILAFVVGLWNSGSQVSSWIRQTTDMEKWKEIMHKIIYSSREQIVACWSVAFNCCRSNAVSFCSVHRDLFYCFCQANLIVMTWNQNDRGNESRNTKMKMYPSPWDVAGMHHAIILNNTCLEKLLRSYL